MFAYPHVLTWLVVGLIGGTLAGRIVMRERAGFGIFYNLSLGCAGAMVGGILFGVFDLFPSLDKISLSLRDVVAAVVGSLILLGALWVWNRRKAA